MNKMKTFSFHEVVGAKVLEFDIYNESGNILANRGQTIAPGMLLKMQYLKLFRKETVKSEHYYFDNLLISETNKNLFLNLLSENNGLIVASSPEKSSKELLLDSIIGYKSENSSVYLVSNSDFQCKFPINYTKADRKTVIPALTLLKTKISPKNNTIIVDSNLNIELFKFICENFAFKNQVIIILNKQDSFSALLEILDLCPDRIMLSYLLNGIILQKPIPSLCSCKQEYNPDKNELNQYFRKESSPNIKLFKPSGCNLCENSGFMGVIQLHEILTLNEEMKAMIKDDFDIEPLKIEAITKGFRDIKYDGLKKVLCGLVQINKINK
jgi:hypothetical protein